jgi:hypothetical protein
MTIPRGLKVAAGLFALALPVFALWFGWRLCEVRSESKSLLSDNRFEQIKCMLLAYHDEHGTFPPIRYQPKANGPIHSWRVLLVPYTDADYKARYGHYDFSQDWNSSDNLKALGNMPFFSYFSAGSDNQLTNYIALGESDDWPSQKPLRARMVTSGKDRFLVVERPDSHIRWMEPTD